MKGKGDVGPCILILSPDEREWSASHPGHFIPCERATVIYWNGCLAAPEPIHRHWRRARILLFTGIQPWFLFNQHMAKSPHYLSSLISYTQYVFDSKFGGCKTSYKNLQCVNVFGRKKILTRCFTAFFMAAVTDNLLWCLKYTYVTSIRYHEIWVHCGTMLYISW